jgi:hypothetical protein
MENRMLTLKHDTSRNEANVGDGNVEDLCPVADAEQGMPGDYEMRSNRGLRREEQQGWHSSRGLRREEQQGIDEGGAVGMAEGGAAGMAEQWYLIQQ